MTIGYDIQEIAQMIEPISTSIVYPDRIAQLLIDSRKSVPSQSVLFFALKGERHDGHQYIDDLIKSGIRNFVVSDEKYISDKANFILCQDTLRALQRLAQLHRKKFNYPVLGITGSNGKTTVKEWLSQLISTDKQIIRSPKSYNSQVGVPLSIWQLSDNDELAIIEAGISLPGEMEKLNSIIQPEWGILTNIGEAHGENFENDLHKTKEKLKLFQGAKILFCNENYSSVASQEFKGKIISYGKTSDNYLQILSIQPNDKSTSISGKVQEEEYVIHIPFTDKASIENACICWIILAWLGYTPNTIKERMKWLQPIAMRLELKQGVYNCSILNDSYNSDFGSLKIALEFLSQQKQSSRKTIILSDILENKKDQKELYEKVAEEINQYSIHRFIGIGEHISKYKHLFQSKETFFFNTTNHFLNEFNLEQFQNEIILLKGARKYSFEKINKALQQKSHETVLEISLDALEHNLNYFKSKLKPNVSLMCMVKAFSYGAGSYEIANLLEFHRVNYLGVAYADEGFELRKNGISLPIMVMSPQRRAFSNMIEKRLEPEIHNFGLLKDFINELNLFSESKKPYPIHLKLDTGMHRLGFEPNDIPELLSLLQKESANVKVKSVFSHLAASDEAAHDNFTQTQIEQFGKMSQTIIDSLEYPIIRHILNSGGIQRFPDAQFDMVRLGVGLYGIGVNDDEQKKLIPVSRFKSTIAQIKEIKKGESIGYGRKGIAQEKTRIATIMIGYADGLSRALSNGNGVLYVKNQPAPIIGNVCMDLCMIDITNIDAKPGDEVIVFDQNHPVSELASKLNTIPYEIMTSISSRVKRIYYQE